MALFRRWLFILGALILGGGQVFAAGSREDRAFAAAAAEFHDELWSRAETDFARFVQRFPQSTNAAQAVLFQAQARFKQKKFADAILLLTDAGNLTRAKSAGLADQFACWTGEAQFAGGDFPAAAATFTALVNEFAGSPLRLAAAVEAAAAFEKQGDWARLDEWLGATNGVFARTAALDGDNELVARGRLLLAQARLAQADFSGAVAELARLNPAALAPEQGWQRAWLLYQAATGAGNFEAARTAATNLVQVAKSQKNSGWPAAASSALGAALEKLGRLPEAAAAYSENLAAPAPAEKQQEAVLKIAALAAAQNDFTNSVANLEKFLSQFPGSPAAEPAGLALGELHLKHFVAQPAATNQLALAREQFSRLLAADTDSPLAGRAFLGRGWCGWLAGNTVAALADFRAAAAERLPVSEELAVAKFKAGDALFVLNDFAGARTNYQAVLDGFADFPAVAKSLGDRALYQVLRADVKLADEAGAQAAMRGLLEKFPASDLGDNGLLLLGEGLSDFSPPENARAVFRQFEKQFPDSPLKPQVALAVARTFEQEQDWAAAITYYADWLEKFPAADLRPQAEFALAQAHFHAGDTTNAFRLFTGFIARFPTNQLAPLAQWWVADDFFRAGNFAGAETNYENIYQNPAWGNSSLFYPARLMAGRAAMGRQSPDAIGYFTKLLSYTNCPPELAVQARFACVAALMQAAPEDTNSPLANLQTATNLLDQICRSHPADETGDRARGELGDCALLMNDFDAATNFYAQVVNSAAAGASLRSRARVGWGLVLEKKAALLPPSERNPLLKLALDNYLDVLYTTNDVADPFWTKKAGLQALLLMISVGESDQNRLKKFFDRLEEKLPQLTEMLEKKKAALGAAKN